ncbi:envelope biogenesis factor ElyC, partial [Vibrio lentus]
MSYRACYSVTGISGIKRRCLFLLLSDVFSDYSDMFELKKVVSSLLMPLPAMLILAFLGLALVMFTTKRKTGCLIT